MGRRVATVSASPGIRPLVAGHERLKSDIFGSISRVHSADAGTRVVRDVSAARWWIAPLARHLAHREARALQRLAGTAGVPRLLGSSAMRVDRSWIEGSPMHRARPTEAHYFREAMSLVRRLHVRGVVHNDLAKEPNWLVTPDGRPALVDFQLAWCIARRNRLFRALAHDDVRHLLKHKRTYRPDLLTAREQRILATRSWPARAWMSAVKPLYRFVTRRVLGWADREGGGDRGVL